MLNIHELETKWIRYKIKSFIPHITIVFSLLIIILILTQFDFASTDVIHTQTNQDIPKQELVITSTDNNNTSIQKTIKKKIHTIKKDYSSLNKEYVADKLNTKLLILPSLDFIRNIQEESPDYYASYLEPTNNLKKNLTTKKINTLKPSSVKIKEIDQVTIIDENTISEIKIKRQNIQGDIQHVIKRFKISNSPALSLFIAKKYYELENYNQSYNYALITNELNNDVEESWIIFAKSLYKLNKKDKAVKILQKYISTSHSHRAKILLDNIKTGKIK